MSPRANQVSRRREGWTVKPRILAVFILILFVATSSPAQSAADAAAAPNQAISDSTRHFEGFPIITGGIALNAAFEPHENNMNPVVAPIFLIPLGHRALIESEVEIESDITYSHGGYEPVLLTKSLEYAQLDFFASKYLTIVAGRFAIPLNIYKERFDARWIRNLSEEPLIFPLADSSGNGGQLRGAIPLGSSAQFGYAAYFSAKTTNVSAGSDRQSGLRTALFFPASEGRNRILLQPLPGRRALQPVRNRPHLEPAAVAAGYPRGSTVLECRRKRLLD